MGLEERCDGDTADIVQRWRQCKHEEYEWRHPIDLARRRGLENIVGLIFREISGIGMESLHLESDSEYDSTG